MNNKQFKKKIIFLDFDGVLNRFHGENSTKNKCWIGTIGFEIELVKNLNHLLENLEKNWDVVISSSWKTYGIGSCLKTLIHYGLDIENLHRFNDRTGNGKTRAEEIINYVDRYSYPVEFIVIDDEYFDIIGDHKDLTDDLRKKLENRFIQTNMKNGLTMEDVEKILNMSKAFDL
jgi:hypothetical protein